MDGTLVGESAFEVPVDGQNQFFVSEKTPLPDAFTGRGRVTCDNPFHIISFYQTDLGGLTNNPTPGSVDAD